MADDGSVVMVGKSNGDLMDSSSSSPVADAYNFVAVKLDSEGAEVWRWQVRPYMVAMRMQKVAALCVLVIDRGHIRGPFCVSV